MIATDKYIQSKNKLEGRFIELDVTDKTLFSQIVEENKVTNIIHLVTVLTCFYNFKIAICESNTDLAYHTNIIGSTNALEIARKHKASIFIPSTLATFGPTLGTNLSKKPIGEDEVQDPITYYGITKVISN